MTSVEALDQATALSAKHQAPVDVWAHALSGRHLAKPASKAPITAPGWRRVLRVDADGTQRLAEDLPANEVLPPDDFTTPKILTASEAVHGFVLWITSHGWPQPRGRDASFMGALGETYASAFCHHQHLDAPRVGWPLALKPFPPNFPPDPKEIPR